MRTREVPGTRRRCRGRGRRHVPGSAMQHSFPGHSNVDDNFRGNSGVGGVGGLEVSLNLPSYSRKQTLSPYYG